MILLDANSLVYAVNEYSPQHQPSKAVVQAALARRVPGVLLPQVLLEFWATITHPRRTQTPLPPAEAWETVEALRAGLPVLDLLPGALDNLAGLVLARRSSGQAVYDLFLVAQMRTHGIGQICTYNTADFSNIPGIEPLTPEQTLVRYGIPFAS